MRLIYCFLAILLLSCTNIKEPIGKENKEMIISLQRTACYGKCPIYKVEIFANGKALYHGERFVQQEGDFAFSVPQEAIELILNKSEEIGFFQMEEEYSAPITDLPKTIIFIKKGNQQKKIVDYYGAPQSLKVLENMVDGCIDYRRMQKIGN